jgi:hypothetical protein
MGKDGYTKMQSSSPQKDKSRPPGQGRSRRGKQQHTPARPYTNYGTIPKPKRFVSRQQGRDEKFEDMDTSYLPLRHVIEAFNEEGVVPEFDTETLHFITQTSQKWQKFLEREGEFAEAVSEKTEKLESNYGFDLNKDEVRKNHIIGKLHKIFREIQQAGRPWWFGRTLDSTFDRLRDMLMEAGLGRHLPATWTVAYIGFFKMFLEGAPLANVQKILRIRDNEPIVYKIKMNEYIDHLDSRMIKYPRGYKKFLILALEWLLIRGKECQACKEMLKHVKQLVMIRKGELINVQAQGFDEVIAGIKNYTSNSQAMQFASSLPGRFATAVTDSAASIAVTRLFSAVKEKVVNMFSSFMSFVKDWYFLIVFVILLIMLAVVFIHYKNNQILRGTFILGVLCLFGANITALGTLISSGLKWLNITTDEKQEVSDTIERIVEEKCQRCFLVHEGDQCGKCVHCGTFHPAEYKCFNSCMFCGEIRDAKHECKKFKCPRCEIDQPKKHFCPLCPKEWCTDVHKSQCNTCASCGGQKTDTHHQCPRCPLRCWESNELKSPHLWCSSAYCAKCKRAYRHFIPTVNLITPKRNFDNQRKNMGVHDCSMCAGCEFFTYSEDRTEFHRCWRCFKSCGDNHKDCNVPDCKDVCVKCKILFRDCRHGFQALEGNECSLSGEEDEAQSSSESSFVDPDILTLDEEDLANNTVAWNEHQEQLQKRVDKDREFQEILTTMELSQAYENASNSEDSPSPDGSVINVNSEGFSDSFVLGLCGGLRSVLFGEETTKVIQEKMSSVNHLNSLFTAGRNVKSLVVSGIEMFTQLVDTVWCWKYKVPYFDATKKMKELYDVIQTQEQIFGTPGVHEKIATDKEFAKKIIDAYQTILQHRKFAFTHKDVFPQLSVELSRMVVSYMPLFEEANIQLKQYKKRHEPVWIYLFGTAGVGKTTLTDFLLSRMRAKLGMSRYIPTMRYERKVAQEFWDGYANHWCTSIDDLFQSEDANERRQLALELVYMRNKNPYPLHMAEIGQKNVTFFESRVIVTTSNDSSKPDQLGIKCPDALYRRRNVVCRVTVPDKYRKDGKPTGEVIFPKVIQWSEQEFSLWKFEIETRDGRKFITFKELADICAAEYVAMEHDADDISKALETIDWSKIDPDIPPQQEEVEAQGFLTNVKNYFGKMISATATDIDGYQEFEQLFERGPNAQKPVTAFQRRKALMYALRNKDLDHSTQKLFVLRYLTSISNLTKHDALKYRAKMSEVIFRNLSLFMRPSTLYDFRLTPWYKTDLQLPIEDKITLATYLGISRFQLYNKAENMEYAEKLTWDFLTSHITPGIFENGFDPQCVKKLEREFWDIDVGEFQTHWMYMDMNLKKRFIEYGRPRIGLLDHVSYHILSVGNWLHSFCETIKLLYSPFELAVGAGGILLMAIVAIIGILKIAMAWMFPPEEWDDVDAQSESPDEKRNDRRWYRKKPVKPGKPKGKFVQSERKGEVMVKANSGADINGLDFATAIWHNIIPVEVTFTNNIKSITYVTFVQGQIAAMADHILEGGTVKEIQLWHEEGDTNPGKTEFGPHQLQIERFTDRDLALIWFKGCRARRSLDYHLVDELKSDYSAYKPARVQFHNGTVLISVGTKCEDATKKVVTNWTSPNTRDHKSKTLINGIWARGVAGEDGACGNPYILLNAKESKKFLGIHVAGHGEDSIIAPICKADFKKFCEVAQIDEAHNVFANGFKMGFQEDPTVEVPEGTRPVGRLDKAIFIPSETAYEPSLVQMGLVDNDGEVLMSPFPIEKIPVALKPFKSKDGFRISPLENVLKTYEIKHTKALPVEFFHEASSKGIFGGRSPSEVILRPLTLKEVINGSEALQIDGISLSTSSGIGYTERGVPLRMENGKGLISKDPFKIAAELQDEIDLQKSLLKEGKMTPMKASICLKDELRKKERVEKGDTRGFAVGEKAHMLRAKEALGAFKAAVQKFKHDSDIALGIDPHSGDWNIIYKKATRWGKSTRFAAMDARKYDTKYPGTAAFPICQAIFRELGYEIHEADKEFWLKEIWAIIHTTLYAVYFCMHFVFEFDGMPSGSWLTALLNSILNSMVIRSCYRALAPIGLKDTFDDNVYTKVLGDDSFQAFNPEIDEWYNMITISKWINFHFNWELTNPDKSPITQKYIPLEDVVFLQRRFRVQGALCFAPLEEASIYGMVNWVKPSKECDNRACTIQNLQAAIREFFHYGETKYEFERKRLNRYIHLLNAKDMVHTTYQEVLQMYCNAA